MQMTQFFAHATLYIFQGWYKNGVWRMALFIVGEIQLISLDLKKQGHSLTSGNVLRLFVNGS